MCDKHLLRSTELEGLTLKDVQDILTKYGASYSCTETLQSLKERVQTLETTPGFTCWHDHSDVYGHGYYLITIWFLYDTAVYLTSNETPDKCNVQSVVERPYLHIIGQSNSSIASQLFYVEERITEIQASTTTITRGRDYNAKLRFYSGDLPARCFEAGNLGPSGRYPCICGLPAASFKDADKVLRSSPLKSLGDRCKHFGNKDPNFEYKVAAMKKKDIERELNGRGIGDRLMKASRKELDDALTKEMKGVVRLPALLSTGLVMADLGCDSFEVSKCDPLHDLKNLIHHLLRELPHHISNAGLRKRVKDFCEGTRGEKRQLKGCDARMHLLDLAILLQSPDFQTDRECLKIYRMVYSLTEIQRLAYQTEEQRCSRNILRFYTSAMKFVAIASELFSDTQVVTKRSLFGTPYHCIVHHMPDMYRYVSLRSIVTETSERMFHELRELSKSSSRRPENILSNAVFRMGVRQVIEKADDKSKAFLQSQKKVENSAVSLAAKELTSNTPACRTILTRRFIEDNKILTLSATKRIADFIRKGPGVWYEVAADDSITFYDGPTDASERGPTHVKHFRNTNARQLADELVLDWQACRDSSAQLQICILDELNHNDINKGQQAGTSTDVPAKKEQRVVARALGAELSASTDISSASTSTKEKVITEIFQGAPENLQKQLKRFITARQNFKITGHKWQEYKILYNALAPFLRKYMAAYERKICDVEKQYYLVNKEFPTTCVDDSAEEKRQVCAHFLKMLKN